MYPWCHYFSIFVLVYSRLRLAIAGAQDVTILCICKFIHISYQSESRMSICRQNKLTLEIGAANPPHLYQCNQQKTQTIPYPPLASLRSLVHRSSQFTYCCTPHSSPKSLALADCRFLHIPIRQTKDRRLKSNKNDGWHTIVVFRAHWYGDRSAFAKVDGRIVAVASCRCMNSLAWGEDPPQKDWSRQMRCA
jgi:hypothetical protein